MRCELDRVVDQAEHESTELSLVAQNLAWYRGLDRELLLLFRRQDPKVIGDLAGKLIEADRCLGLGSEPGILAEEEQEVLAQPGQVLDLLEHVFQALAVLLRITGDAERNLGLIAKNGKRSAQLVSGVGREPADFLERSLEPRDHAVERPGQPSELVVRVGRVQPPVELAGGDLVGRGSHAVHRGERLAGQKVAAAQRARHGQRACQKHDGQQLTELPFVLVQGRGNLNQSGSPAPVVWRLSMRNWPSPGTLKLSKDVLLCRRGPARRR